MDTRGKQQTLLSRQYAPPKLNAEEEGRKTIRSAIFWLTISVIAVLLTKSNESLVTVPALVAVFSFVRLYVGFSDASNGRKEDQKNQEVYRNWERTFLCFTCGNLFIP